MAAAGISLAVAGVSWGTRATTLRYLDRDRALLGGS